MLAAAGLIAASIALSRAEQPQWDCADDVVDFLQRDHDVRSRLGVSRSACEDKFGTFGDGKLTGTQLVPESLAPSEPLSFDSFEHWPGLPWYDASAAVAAEGTVPALMVSAEHKFAICNIPKVASSDWTVVVGKLMTNNVSIQDKFDSMDHLVYPNPESMAKVFSDPTATRLAVVRDPLSRFRSAMMSKCDPSRDNYPGECPMASSDKAASMRIAIEWALAQNLSSPSIEPHWMLQSEFCELKKRVAEYTVIGLYSKESLSQDATCIMQMANLEQFNKAGPEDDALPYWHSSGSTDAAEIEVLQKIFTRDAALKFVNHAHLDYGTFNFPIPAWIAGATGEWFELPMDEVLRLAAL